jgi:hypothetical protein
MADDATNLDRIASWLRSQGHDVTVVAHNERHSSVCFKARGALFTVHVDEEDRALLSITHGWRAPFAPRARTDAMTLALEVQRRIPVVKVDLDWKDGYVRFAAEQLVVNASFEGIFWRCVDLLSQAAQMFFETLGDTAPEEAARSFIEELERTLGRTSGER